MTRRTFLGFMVFCVVALSVSVFQNVRISQLVKESKNQSIQAAKLCIETETLVYDIVTSMGDTVVELMSKQEELNCDPVNETKVCVTNGIHTEPFTNDAVYLAKTVWGEARGCSVTEQAAVMWCILNRVDNSLYPDSVEEVVTQPSQFFGYSPDNPIDKEILSLANEVLESWKTGDESGRVLPKEYLYFTGDGKRNYFYTVWGDTSTPWDWSLPSPYEEE